MVDLLVPVPKSQGVPRPAKLEASEIGLALVDLVRQTIVEAAHSVPAVAAVALVGETVAAKMEFEVVESDGFVQAVVAVAHVGKMVVENHQSEVVQHCPVVVVGGALRAVVCLERRIAAEAFRLGLDFDFVGSRLDLADLVVEVLDAEMTGSDFVVLGTVDYSVQGWVDLGFLLVADGALEAVAFVE